MQEKTYVFLVTPRDPSCLLAQISRALELQTQLASRARLPRLWRGIDCLRAHGGGQKRRRGKIGSIVCLILGAFLLIPGLAAPRELPAPLFAGAIGVAVGIGGLCSGRKSMKNRFDRSARLLLEKNASVLPGQVQIRFDAAQMTICTAQDAQVSRTPYACFERVIETEDAFLLIFDKRAAVLHKQDLADADAGDFRNFMAARTALVAAL